MGVWQIGEVAERLNAADLKSADGGAVRGFESLPLRRIFRLIAGNSAFQLSAESVHAGYFNAIIRAA